MPAFVIGSVSMKLEASDSAQGKKFGTYVAIDGTTIIAGSPADFSKGTNSGAALVFTKADGVWTEQAKSAGADTGIDALLGQVVAVSNDTVVLGAPGTRPWTPVLDRPMCLHVAAEYGPNKPSSSPATLGWETNLACR